MLQLWFVSRALGAMALLLLSVVIVLGILHNTSVVKNADLGLPRFVLVALHRNLSLISVVFIALHVITVIVTDYVHLRIIDVFVPGIATFNPVAAAFGTVATDLVLAIVVTSMLRSRLSRRVWFWVHWTSYLCWPVSVVHAVLNASFRGTTWWTLAVPLLSMVAIVAALVYRRRDRRRVGIPVAERGKVSEEAIRAGDGGAADRAAGRCRSRPRGGDGGHRAGAGRTGSRRPRAPPGGGGGPPRRRDRGDPSRRTPAAAGRAVGTAVDPPLSSQPGSRRTDQAGRTSSATG